MSVKDLTAALVERFSTIGVLKIDKKTMEPKSKPDQDNFVEKQDHTGLSEMYSKY